MKVNEVNCETKTDIVRDANESEAFLIEQAKIETEEISTMLEEIAVKKSALIAKLNITEEEAHLLFGGK
jgi:hypothetical protein